MVAHTHSWLAQEQEQQCLHVRQADGYMCICFPFALWSVILFQESALCHLGLNKHEIVQCQLTVAERVTLRIE